MWSYEKDIGFRTFSGKTTHKKVLAQPSIIIIKYYNYNGGSFEFFMVILDEA